ncbi:G2F domain [Mactra antiquata]
MANTHTGSYFLLVLSLFNLAALTCVVVYNIKYSDNGFNLEKDNIVRQITDEISGLFQGRSRRDVDETQEPVGADKLENILQIERSKLLEECRSVAKEEIVTVLKEALLFMKPVRTESKRQTNTAGNELAAIFGEIAKTEVDILTQYCGNNSHVCLPGEKGERGDAGIGLKGEQGIAGVQGIKGDPGTVGLKGEPGLGGAQGPLGPKGESGSKGEPGLYGIPGSKGQRGVMGPQGLKGEVGPIGFKGEKGDTGLDGRNGAQGVQGPKGDKGEPYDVVAPVPSLQTCCTSLSVPSFTTQVEEIRVTEGSNVTIMCNPRGYPAPSLTWNPVPLGSTFTPNSLTMTNVRVQDSNTLTCLAENALGTSQKNYIVKVYQHLKFDRIPQNHTVMTGNPVTMECHIDGPLDPNISWYKVMPDGSKAIVTTGVVTTAGNVSQLHFDHVDSGREGQYICEGNNGVENIQMTAFLKTFGPPHIRPQGQITVMKGDTARLVCQADAEPPATISWTYPPGVTNAYVDSDGSLVIVSANDRDSRYFICTASNKYGSDKEQLTVVVKYPAEVSLTPDRIAVDPGKTTIALQCLPKGDQPLTVEWEKDGIPVIGNSHVFVLPGNVLLINQANSADLGEYSCKATNSLGTATSTALAYFDAGNVQCPSTFADCTEHVCRANCPPGCATDASPAVQLGATYYTQGSSICKAGLLSGIVTTAGGEVIWKNVGFRAELVNIQTPTP